MFNRRTGWMKVGVICLSIGLLTSTMPFLASSESGNGGTTNNRAQEKKYKEGEIIVKFKNGQSVESLHRTQVKHHLIEKMDFPQTQTQLLSFNVQSTIEQVISDLLGSGLVEYAEPNYERSFSFSEPLYVEQWGMKNTGQPISGVRGTPGIDIDAERAWAQTMGSKRVVVGVIDSGIDIHHPDLKDQIWKNPGEIPGDGIDNDGNGYVDDVNGWNFYDDNNEVFQSNREDAHGTHVAGVIAAKKNKAGVIGVASNVKIMPLKIVAEGGYVSDELEAIAYARDKGVKLINMSLGGWSSSQAEYDAIKNTNALFVVAAGNNSRNIDGFFSSYPSGYNLPNIISVTAIDHQGNVPYWSNYGTKNTDLAAPGVWIFSTLPDNNYGFYSGTSMAAPYVTGTAALLLSKNPSASPLQIKETLLSNTTPLSSLTRKVSTGGMLNAGKALNAKMGGKPVRRTTTYTQEQSTSLAPSQDPQKVQESQEENILYRFFQRFFNWDAN